MKPVMRNLSPATKQALTQTFDAAVKKSRKQGYDAGWHRGFRVGALLALAALSTAGLVVVGVAWVMS